jgi:hypothetical protein
MWTHERLERRRHDVDGELVNPPAELLDAPAGRTESGAVEYDYEPAESTASAAIVQIAAVVTVDRQAFASVPLDEYAAAPIEGEIDYDEPAERLRRSRPVAEAESASAFPGSPFGV